MQCVQDLTIANILVIFNLILGNIYKCSLQHVCTLVSVIHNPGLYHKEQYGLQSGICQGPTWRVKVHWIQGLLAN